MASKTSQIDSANKQIGKLNGEISKLKTMIDLEKQKTCPKDSTCTTKSRFTNKSDDRQCTGQILIELLKKSGLTETEIQKVQPYLDYQPGINNFPIKTHPMFYKYSKILEVAPCNGITCKTHQDSIKQVLPLKDSMVNNTEQNPLQQQQNPTTDQINQKEALNIFQKALLEYNRVVATNKQNHKQNQESRSSQTQQETNKNKNLDHLKLNRKQTNQDCVSIPNNLNDNSQSVRN